MSRNIINEKDLIENPSARLGVCICLDTSGSMIGAPIQELNEGVKLFFNAIKDDDNTLASAEICIITFGDTVHMYSDFTTIDNQPTIPQFTANGLTPMGEAVNKGLDALEERKQKYKDAGVDYYQPWLVIMSDGRPCNYDNAAEEEEMKKASQRVYDLCSNKKLVTFAIGIGSEADFKTMERFSPNRRPLKLQGLKFPEFFTWLAKSVSRTSQSTPGDKVELDKVDDWAEGWGDI